MVIDETGVALVSVKHSEGYHKEVTKQAEKAEKKRSPLRQSLKNFLSVFSKRGKASSKDSVDISSRSPRVVLFPHSESKSPSEDPFIDRRPSTQFQEDGDCGSSICRSPTYALHSGQLLHLFESSPFSSQILPVWTSCQAILHNTHLLLTSQTSQGIASTDVVSLSNCTDVRSVSIKDLDPDEHDLLPAFEQETARVFELIFEGKKRERFAAASIQARAGWVSAIW